ncbi:ABC transporter G family member 20 [Folsomia candida]|uniref:ABC transporter G family member 20 n=1 Tax=Folsomia candida TaxID=158441 RepID=A0A226DW92_FOLCA|nr:ABC transporter G family member 20 [Folsomia candida]
MSEFCSTSNGGFLKSLKHISHGGPSPFEDASYGDTTSFQRIKALVTKNYMVMTRNLMLLVFMMFTPALQVFVMCLAIGNDPKPMWMGVVNHEMNYTPCSTTWLRDRGSIGGCDVKKLSCKFLMEVPKDTIYLRDYETNELASDAVRSGEIWGFLSFPENFSENVYERAISFYIKKELYDAFERFLKGMLINCGFYKELAESPIRYLDGVYGTDDTGFKEFIAPGILLCVIFFFPLCSSETAYIWDKKQGTLERSMVAGVQSWEIMTSFLATEGIVVVIQCFVSFFMIIYIFEIEILESFALSVMITIMMGLAGVSMGFLLASFCDEEIEAVMLSIATFFPNMILSGILWPIEGMPLAMQYITYFLPSRLASVR